MRHPEGPRFHQRAEGSSVGCNRPPLKFTTQFLAVFIRHRQGTILRDTRPRRSARDPSRRVNDGSGRDDSVP